MLVSHPAQTEANHPASPEAAASWVRVRITPLASVSHCLLPFCPSNRPCVSSTRTCVTTLPQTPSLSYISKGPCPTHPGSCTQTWLCLWGADTRLVAVDMQAMQPQKTPAGTTLKCVIEQGTPPFCSALGPIHSGQFWSLDSEKSLRRICPGRFPGQRPKLCSFLIPAPSVLDKD